MFYRYLICCVDVPWWTDMPQGTLIEDMREAAVDITYKTAQKHCTGLMAWAVDKGYELNRREGLTLANDFSVSFHKSVYDGMPCYYVQWSGIEYIWVAADHEKIQKFMPGRVPGDYWGYGGVCKPNRVNVFRNTINPGETLGVELYQRSLSSVDPKTGQGEAV